MKLTRRGFAYVLWGGGFSVLTAGSHSQTGPERTAIPDKIAGFRVGKEDRLAMEKYLEDHSRKTNKLREKFLPNELHPSRCYLPTK